MTINPKIIKKIDFNYLYKDTRNLRKCEYGGGWKLEIALGFIDLHIYKET